MPYEKKGGGTRMFVERKLAESKAWLAAGEDKPAYLNAAMDTANTAYSYAKKLTKKMSAKEAATRAVGK